MFRPLRCVQNHINITIDTANLRWLLPALDDLPSGAEGLALVPDDADPFPTGILLPAGW